MRPERLKSLRLARGLSMDELVAKMDGFVSKQALSKYERGLIHPSATVIVKLSKALEVKSRELWAEPDVEVNFVRFRKKALLGQKEQSRLLNLLQLELERRVKLQELVSPGQRPEVPGPFKVTHLEEAEDAAIQVRNKWKLGEAPIRNLIELLECHLIHVVEIDAPATFDGVSANIVDAEDKTLRGTAVVSRLGLCGERQRMNLAHELAHLVEDPQEGVDEEKAAFRFAAALLVPAEPLRCMIGNNRSAVAEEELKQLRAHFGVSMQALLYRMKELGIISDRHATEWWKRFAKEGWRKKEPEESDPEESRWLRRTVMHAFTEELLSFDDAADLLGTEEGLPMPESVKQRRAFLSLPAEEQSRLLREQAERAAQDEYHLKQGKGWEDVAESNTN